MHTPDVVRRAIAGGDTSTLTRVPGIGKKGAERLVLELRDRIGALPGDGAALRRRRRRRGRGPSRSARRWSGSAGPPEQADQAVAAVAEQLDGETVPPVPVLLKQAIRHAGHASDDRDPSASSAFDGWREEDLVSADATSERTPRRAAARRLIEFIAQHRVREQLDLLLQSAMRRGSPPDHILLSGSPGLGKTTLAMIVAAELGAGLRITSGPAIERSGDLAAVLTSLAQGDVLFIDEIHRIARPAEELLYSAMEDFRVDVVVGKGPGATAIPLDVEPFTLVGATTRAGLLTGPMRDRFGFVGHLDFYEPDELERAACTARRGSSACRSPRTGAVEIAGRSRGTPRIANRLLRRVRDYAEVRGDGVVDRPRPRPRCGSTTWTSSAWTGWTGRCWWRWSARSAGGRWGCPRSRWRWVSNRTPSKRSASRSCARRAAGPYAAWPGGHGGCMASPRAADVPLVPSVAEPRGAGTSPQLPDLFSLERSVPGRRDRTVTEPVMRVFRHTD